MQCNIDQSGRRVRLINGIVLVAIGLAIIAFWAARNDSVWPWVLAALAIISGGFSIFEARKGWCALRAMGIKTKI
jgi:uncharacterized membrane protein HdeD (DUF308 family)